MTRGQERHGQAFSTAVVGNLASDAPFVTARGGHLWADVRWPTIGRRMVWADVRMEGTEPMMERTPVEQDLARQDAALADFVKQHAHPLTDGDLTGYDPLLEMIGAARIVMIGDGSHGTHEFYRERALITTRLIEEKASRFVAIEGPWPDVWRLNAVCPGRRRNGA